LAFFIAKSQNIIDGVIDKLIDWDAFIRNHWTGQQKLFFLYVLVYFLFILMD